MPKSLEEKKKEYELKEEFRERKRLRIESEKMERQRKKDLLSRIEAGEKYRKKQELLNRQIPSKVYKGFGSFTIKARSSKPFQYNQVTDLKKRLGLK